MEIIELKSLNDINNLVIQLADSNFSFEKKEIHFDNNILKFKLGFHGDIYDKIAITGENARALADFQSAIYRIGALILKGEDNARRLTREEIASLSMRIQIGDGSTILDMLFDHTIGLFNEGLKDMESKHKAIVLCFAAIVLASSATTVLVMDSLNSKEIKQTEQSTKLSIEQEQSKQMELITSLARNVNSDLVKVTEIHQEAIKGIIKSSFEASRVTAGGITFTSENITEMNQRSSRSNPISEVIDVKCIILNISTKDSSLTKITLSEITSGNEYTAIYDDNNFTEEENEFFWSSARLRKQINLKVNKVLTDKTVKTAQVIEINIPKPQS